MSKQPAHPLPCITCACTAKHPAHAQLAALREDDLDAALAQGLLDALPCPACAEACNAALLDARDARRFALAARARHHTRALRLARIQREREAARRPASVFTPAQAQAPAQAAQPAAATLPSAAADALARALAKAKARHA
jgi:hypothetical protein